MKKRQKKKRIMPSSNRRTVLSVRSSATATAPAKKPSEHSRDIPEITTRTMTVRAKTIDEKARTVDAVLSTENPVTVYDYDLWRVIDEILLASGRVAPEQMPLLENHNRYSLDCVLGSIRNIRSEGTDTIGQLQLIEGDEMADSAWRKVAQGHITDVSVGYRSEEYVDIPAGQTQIVNGKSYTAGAKRTLRVTTKWIVREASLTPIGADPGAKIRDDKTGLNTRTSQEPRTMDKKLRKYLEKIGLRKEATEAEAYQFIGELEDEQERAEVESLRTGKKSGAGTSAAAPSPGASPEAKVTEQEREAIAQAEADRRDAIDALRSDRTPQDVYELAIKGDKAKKIKPMTVDEAGRAFLEAERRATPGAVGAGSGVPSAPNLIMHREMSNDDMKRGMVAGVLMKLGRERCLIDTKASNERKLQQERLLDIGSEYQSMSIVDICRECLRAEGKRAYGMSPRDSVRAALATGTLTTVFSTSAQKALMDQWETAPDSTQGWCAEKDVPNFKTNDEFAIVKGKTTDKRLPRGGTAKMATIAEVAESWKVKRYANQFAWDEQDMIDDDQGALQEKLPDMIDEMLRIRPELVYSKLLANPTLAQDSIALFHASHGNLGTGAGSAMANAGLRDGLTAMGKQTENGVPLNLNAVYLIVPWDIKWDSKQLASSAILFPGSATATNGTSNPIFDENIIVRSDQRIGVAGVTDPSTGTAYPGTATNWFLAAQSRRGIVVGYLQGTGRRPQLQTYTLDKGQWGMGFALNFDIGVCVRGYQPLYKSNGV